MEERGTPLTCARNHLRLPHLCPDLWVHHKPLRKLVFPERPPLEPSAPITHITHIIHIRKKISRLRYALKHARILRKKLIIGRTDIADFPKLNLEDIPVKIDTGAYTSSIHCRNIEVKRVEGVDVLTFMLLDPSHPQFEEEVYSTEHFRETVVKSSNGQSETRYLIKTNILLFGRKNSISLTLSERGEMRFPILIGRKFLMGKFIVDPSQVDLSHQHKVKDKAQ